MLCRQVKGAKSLRWSRNSLILTSEQSINKVNPSYEKLKIDIKSDGSQYNLHIANVTVDDFGIYICEIQTNQGISIKRVTLKRKGNT